MLTLGAELDGIIHHRNMHHRTIRKASLESRLRSLCSISDVAQSSAYPPRQAMTNLTLASSLKYLCALCSEVPTLGRPGKTGGGARPVTLQGVVSIGVWAGLGWLACAAFQGIAALISWISLESWPTICPIFWILADLLKHPLHFMHRCCDISGFTHADRILREAQLQIMVTNWRGVYWEKSSDSSRGGRLVEGWKAGLIHARRTR